MHWYRSTALSCAAAASLLVAGSEAVRAQPFEPRDGEEQDVDLGELEEALAADAEELTEDRPARPAGGIAGAVQSLNPDISFILDIAFAWFSDDDNLQTGAHDPTENGFNLQQVEMAVGKAVDPYFRVDGNIVFGQFGVEVEELYATTLALPHNLQARIGQFLTRFGRINATHPHAWAFVDQPFILGRYFGGENSRGAGAELSYLTPLPWFVEVVGSVTNPSGEASARSFFGGQDLELETPLDLLATVAVEQFFELSPNWSMMWGLSLAAGPNATGHDNRTDIYGTDIYLKYRPITRQSDTVIELQAEWLYRRRQIPDDLTWDHGGYAYLSWRFTRRWAAAGRYEYGQHARGAGGSGAGDELDPDWTDHRHRVSGNLTFWPTEYSRLRAQTSVDIPTWRDDPIVAGFLSFEFSIGAHGAHDF